MEKIDIKALARELKQTAANDRSAPPTQRTTLKEVSSVKTKTASRFKSMIDAAQQRQDFKFGHHVYIDSEIHEILRQIKAQTKLKLSNLVSLLLEEFILEHKSDISKLIKKKSNRLI